MSSQEVGRILRQIELQGYEVETDTADELVCMAALTEAGEHVVVTARSMLDAARELAALLEIQIVPPQPAS